MTNADDWRLQGQARLTGVTLYWRKYSRHRDGSDHDHCAFCWAKFMEEEVDTLHEGYTTSDNRYWICETCFMDFREKFQAGDLICAVLTTAFEALETFEREVARRGITVSQALAAAIAHGLAEHGLLRSAQSLN